MDYRQRNDSYYAWSWIVLLRTSPWSSPVDSAESDARIMPVDSAESDARIMSLGRVVILTRHTMTKATTCHIDMLLKHVYLFTKSLTKLYVHQYIYIKI